MSFDNLDPNDYGKAPKITEEQQRELDLINQELASLLNHAGWRHLCEIVSRKTQLPKLQSLKAEEAVEHASKLVYITGLKDVIEIPQKALKTLQTQEAAALRMKAASKT